VPPADQLLKDNASTAKSKARSAAAKDPTLAAGLQEKLEGIDAVCATNRRQLARTTVSLPWPARATVIATRAAPRPKPPASELARLRKAAAQAEANVADADATAVAAKRQLARVKAQLRKIRDVMGSAIPISCKEPSPPAEVLDRLKRQHDEVCAMWDELFEWSSVCEEALLDAKEAAAEARDAVELEQRAQVWRAQQEQRAQQWKQQQEHQDAEWEKSHAEEDAAQAATQAATQARIARLERELSALKCEETREWLAAEEARANWQTPPAECKVISLVGASPAQMHSLAAEQGVAEVDRSRILISRLGEPDVMAPEV